jgi:hypothetical protein
MQINPNATTIGLVHQPKQPPAQAARELMASQPEGGKQSFGQLVSKIARGEPIDSQAD